MEDKDSILMSYLFSDGTIGKKINGKTPIAICVAPPDHFDDGYARFMSLKWISKSETSGVSLIEKMKWGKYGQVVSELTLYGKSASTINPDGTFKEINSTNSLKDLPVGVTRPKNNTTYYLYNGWWYQYSVDGGYPAIPPPFLNNRKTKNQIYFMEGQAFCDVDGLTNTSTICTYTAPEYEAAPAAKAYSPGFLDGLWYLPAAGELGYIRCLLQKINKAIENANNECPDCGAAVTSKLWSSTQSSRDGAISIDMTNGGLYNDYKHSDLAGVRAFLKVQII